MIDILKDILPYISGLYTLPWIIVGFIVTTVIGKVFGRNKVDRVMNKIGLVLLYFFIPLLVFRIFLDLFEPGQVTFVIIVFAVISLMYIIAYYYARYIASKNKLKNSKKNLFIKTMLTNQGRSSAFVGSAMMAYWPIEAGIMIALVGIALFAVIPYILSKMHERETKKTKEEHIKVLPWFLKLYPWYLIAFVISAIALNLNTNITTADIGEIGFILKFYTALTIPAALYYVGASIHPRDLKISEIKKLLKIDKSEEKEEHWSWVRSIFLLTVIITPLIIAIIFTTLYAFSIIPIAWFAVIIINTFLPITSTNIFLHPYGIDKKSTAHSVTWTTIVCVPIVVFLITIFEIYI